MVVSDKLKQLIFKRLYKELGNCEIIPYNSSVWFINRDNKYWYFELDKDGTLWWRYDLFNSFFEMFSLGSDDFCPILSSWVEEVLNHNVSTTFYNTGGGGSLVEDVLNSKVSTTTGIIMNSLKPVQEVLNSKVSTTGKVFGDSGCLVEEILNHKVSTTEPALISSSRLVEEVLETKSLSYQPELVLDMVLNQK